MKHLLFYWKNGNVYLMKLASEALLKYACKAPFETQVNFPFSNSTMILQINFPILTDDPIFLVTDV